MNKFYEELRQILEEDQIEPARKLDSFVAWDSLAALSLTAAVRANFGVVLTAEDLKRPGTVGDLEALVHSRMNP